MPSTKFSQEKKNKDHNSTVGDISCTERALALRLCPPSYLQ